MGGLLALIGDGVDALLLDLLGKKVAPAVVAAEEAEGMVLDLAFNGTRIRGVTLDPGAKGLDLLAVSGPTPRPRACPMALSKSSLHLALPVFW